MLTRAEIKEAVQRVVAAAGVPRGVLFGSHARGDAAPDSDPDLVVIVDGVPHRGRKMVRLHNAIGRIAPGIGVDALVCGESEAVDPVSGSTLYRALREVYEA